MLLCGARRSTGYVFSGLSVLNVDPDQVHDENIVPLKLAIMKHLPVLGE